MESQKINILLQKYFEAETTLEEENKLINYFASDKVEEELKSYVPLFSGLRQFSEEEERLTDDLMNSIPDLDHKEKQRYSLRIRILTAVAASVIMGMLAVNFFSHPKSSGVTITDQQKAYEEVTKAFRHLAGEYNESVAELAPIKRIGDATDPLHSSFGSLSKGFNQMKEITKINNEFKNQ